MLIFKEFEPREVSAVVRGMARGGTYFADTYYACKKEAAENLNGMLSEVYQRRVTCYTCNAHH